MANKGFSQKPITEWQTVQGPDKTARYESSHLDLYYLQKYIYWIAGMKRFTVVIVREKKTTKKHCFKLQIYCFAFVLLYQM